MNVSLHTIKQCFEGMMPAGLATCSKTGVPNVTYLSQVHLIDESHVALSFQFFNKTKSNLSENSQASLLVIDPHTCIQYRLQLNYVKQETEGRLFDVVKTKLDAVASMSGMSNIFFLKGIDIYRVLECECMEQDVAQGILHGQHSFGDLNEITQSISECNQIDILLDTTLDLLNRYLGFAHTMLLLQDSTNESLYTIASHGYEKQGSGAEVIIGEGIIGMAAKQRKPVKITNMQRENIMVDAINAKKTYALETRIELPGLAHPGSQLAVPIEANNKLLGVLFLESEDNMIFTNESQELISSIANHLGTAILLCNDEPSSLSTITDAPSEEKIQPLGEMVKLRHFKEDNSIFINSDYLIKGVAGAILWYLVEVHRKEGRSEFTNRELRKAPELGLPEIADNLEARLILLLRRLNDRCDCIKIEKTGRGRFSLLINNHLDTMSVSSA